MAYPDRVLELESSNFGLHYTFNDADPGDFITLDQANPVGSFLSICRLSSGRIKMGIDAAVGLTDKGIVAMVWVYTPPIHWTVNGWFEKAWGKPGTEAEWLTDVTFADTLD